VSLSGIEMTCHRQPAALRPIRFGVAFALLLLESCGAGGAGDAQAPPHGGSYLPLAEGHRLEFRVNMDGNKVGMTQEVRGTREIDGRTYGVLLTSFSDGVINDDPTYYREDDSGVYSGDPDHARETLFLPSPTRSDTEWTVESPRWVTRYSASSISEVEVEGRTYRNCLHVITESQSRNRAGSVFRSTAWYAPGIGNIKVEGTSPSGGSTTVLVKHVR
jgi:hypothetical protein